MESEPFLSLLDAIGGGAGAPELERLLESSDLDRMLPGLGLGRELGLRCLAIVANPDRRLRAEGQETQVVEYFGEMLRQRGSIEPLLDQLASSEDDLLAAASVRTATYLPPGTKIGRPRLVPLPLAFDFRTDRETVFFDPLAALALGSDGFRHTLAHELHHVARYRITGINLTLMRPDERPPPTGAREVFNEWTAWLEAEGIADLVSNITETDVPQLRGATDRRVQQMANYAELIEASMRGLRTASRPGELEARELSQLRQRLLDIAHPVGARMAGTIEAAVGRSALIECVGRPGQFLESFNEAAMPQGLRSFDEDLIAWARR